MFVTQFVKSTFEGDYSLNGINDSVSKFGKVVEEVALHIIKSSGEMFFYAVDSVKYAFKATLENSSAFFSQTIKATANLINRLFSKSTTVVEAENNRVGDKSSLSDDKGSTVSSSSNGLGESLGESNGTTNPKTIEDSITVGSTDKATEIQEFFSVFLGELRRMSEDNSFTDSEKEEILAQMKEGMQSLLEGFKIGTSFAVNEIRGIAPSKEEIGVKLKSGVTNLVQRIKNPPEKVKEKDLSVKDGQNKEGAVVNQDSSSTGGFWGYFGRTTTGSSASEEKK